MKTILIAALALGAFHASEEARTKVKKKRGSLGLAYPLSAHTAPSAPDLGYSEIIPTHNGWTGSFPELTVEPTSSGFDGYIAPPPLTNGNYDLKVNLQPTNPILSTHPSNSLDKPVFEYQELVPPQTFGQALLPQRPVPAVPVNAAASNVPGNGGAVFLGSGGLGVVSLGNGAYALGSGSIGYSENRSQPRPTGSVPVYPPLQASPNLIPAAVPSPAPLQSFPQFPGAGFPIQLGNGIEYNHPILASQGSQVVPIRDQNGYEYLNPSSVSFGSPNPRPLRPRFRQQYATPTALQLPQQFSQQLPQQFFGQVQQFAPSPQRQQSSFQFVGSPQISTLQSLSTPPPQLPSASFDFSFPVGQSNVRGYRRVRARH